MRKYFLLSAVALIAATTANATTDYAEVTAKATIEVANKYDCGEVNWGTIVVKQNNSDILLQMDSDTGKVTSGSDDVISVTGASRAQCDNSETELYPEGMNIPSITLRADGKTQTLTYAPDGYGDFIGGSLTIPAKIEAGTYTGSFTITETY
ncbi:MAG: DUF4402 domain-containing protein [Alphaproteobacteria bacterium]|nr:DUF4402 domain-containing protein [Alphaproteobacteria bacterium]